MKKMILSLCGLATVCIASAQLSFGVNANYTMYKGNMKENTPGFGARVTYAFQDKATGVLSYTHGLAIKTPSVVTLSGSNGDSKYANSEINYNFKTFNLMGQYALLGGDEESSGKFYGLVGAGLVLVKYDEVIKENYDNATYSPMDQVSGSESGFTINLGVGGEYKLGAPSLFAEAGIALPANQVGNAYVDNAIPLHFTFNAGVKFSLGGSSN